MLAYFRRFMPNRLPNFEHSFGFILTDITRLARREFDRRVRPLGLTRAQWMLLYYVARTPGSTQVELADALQVGKISVGQQAARLLRGKWIVRHDHGEDRRAYRIFLTAKSTRMIVRLAKLAGRMRDDYMQGLSAVRQAAMMDALLHIKANLLRMDVRAKSS